MYEYMYIVQCNRALQDRTMTQDGNCSHAEYNAQYCIAQCLKNQYDTLKYGTVPQIEEEYVTAQHCTEAEFLDEVQTKVFRVFLLTIHSHLYSFALRFLFLQTHATSYSFCNSVIVHCKRERGKPEMVEEIYTETSSLRTLKIMPIEEGRAASKSPH
jgi:hypothetical protein